MNLRVGLGFDVHPFGGTGPLILAGVEIPGATGLVGHSDADVAAHAVADALLGAAGLPDLGSVFPASDEKISGASSIGLLAAVVELVADAGWQVINIDVVIAAEQPSLASYIAAMVSNLSTTVGGVVSVKPKHAEGVGAVGRGEGVAAWAVALLESRLES